MKAIITFVIVSIISINFAFGQTVASNDEVKVNTSSSSISANVNVTIISEVHFCQSIDRPAVIMQTRIIDGEEFYYFVDMQKVVFITNIDDDDTRNTYWFGNTVSVKEVKRIMKVEKVKEIGFNTVNLKGQYMFNNHRPF